MATTNMAEPASWLLAALGGAALGLFFFGGLWWTLRRTLVRPAPAAWLLASLLLRAGVTLPGLWLLGGGQGPRMAACLVGFVAVRQLLVARAQRAQPPCHRAQESADAARP